MTMNTQVFLFYFEFIALCHFYLHAHKVQSGDELGDRMFHLQAGIHFEEVVIQVGIYQEFNSSGTHIVTGSGHIDRTFAHGLPHALADHCTGCFFHQFLMPSLDAAFSFKEVDHIAMSVGHHLHFNMPRTGHEFLDEDRTIAERTFRLAHGTMHLLFHFCSILHHTHTFPTSTGTGFDKDRIAGFFSHIQGFFNIADSMICSRHHGNTKILHRLLGFDLTAHSFNAFRIRTDKDEPGLLHLSGESGILAEKSVTRMDGISTGLFGNGNDLIAQEVRLITGRRTQQHGFICKAHVHGVSVGL